MMLSFSKSSALAALLMLFSTVALGADEAETPPLPAATPVDTAASEVSTEAAAETPADDLVDLDDLRAFAAVYNEVRRSYVEPVSSKELMQAAIRGLLADLDPHSQYLDNDQLFSLQDDATGSYGGLGLEVQVMDGKLTVISPIDETPASRAGLRSGDIIVEVDGIPVDVDTANDAVDAMRGKPGSTVKISVFREGSDPFRVDLTREVIKVTSVRSRLLDPKVGYIRVSQFQDESGRDTAAAVKRLQESSGGLAGLVLDLRSNPGGLLTAAVEVSDVFMDGGQVVSTRGRAPNTAASLNAGPDDLLAGAPLVVLVDAGTASASEIVAGALQDHERALIMGQRTFGKGSVQSIMPLENGEALKITTARYYTPNGRSIQAFGIDPDVVLAEADFKRRASSARRISEADLPGHLRGELEGTGDEDEKNDNVRGPGNDYALTEALSVVRALSKWRARNPTSTEG